MSFFDAFTPEGMLKAMGINPQDMLAEYARWKAEFDGMKAGVQQATSHFNTQLNTVHQNQSRLETKLDTLLSLQAEMVRLLNTNSKEILNGHVNGYDSGAIVHNGRDESGQR